MSKTSYALSGSLYLHHVRYFILAGLSTIIFTACIPTLPTPMSAWQAGQKQMQAGEWSEARRSFELELRQHPKNLKARYNLALLLMQNGQADDAAALYRDNLTIGWHFPSAINLAQWLQTSGKTAEAITLLQQATEKSPHEATPWYLLAEIEDVNGHQKKADAMFKHALKADPANGYAHLRFAAFQSRTGLADHGLSEAKKALSLLPECATCWRQYGDILMRAPTIPEAEKIQQAQAAYQHSLAIHPAWQTRQKQIDLLRLAGKTEQAARMQEALHAWRKQHPERDSP